MCPFAGCDAGQTREYHELAIYQADEREALEEFLSFGLISEAISTIKSGKEATAYLCRGTKKLGARLAVAKVYHEQQRRNFANEAMYNEGQVILNGQVRRALAKKTEMGRAFQASIWVNREFETLSALEYAGCDVPTPYFATDEAILMEFVGSEGEAAAQLQHSELTNGEAAALLERLLWNVERFLGNNIVHGDLSAFNVLWTAGAWKIIDFPQAVDPRFAAPARKLLERDLVNLGRYFARYGIELDAARTADSLWQRFRYGELS